MQPYKKLYTYWFSVIVYDNTVKFCDKWIRSWKLKEQMNGAARSGKQNIVEGSDDMTVSLKVAINLTGVAKGSLEELTGDLEDFLRQRELSQWAKTDPRIQKIRAESAEAVRNLSNLGDLSILSNLKLPDEQEEATNWLLTFCHQATYLLHRQVDSLKRKHAREGGLTEELYNKRKTYRGY